MALYLCGGEPSTGKFLLGNDIYNITDKTLSFSDVTDLENSNITEWDISYGHSARTGILTRATTAISFSQLKKIRAGLNRPLAYSNSTLSTVSFPKLETITINSWLGSSQSPLFQLCSGLTEVHLDSFTSSDSGVIVFWACNNTAALDIYMGSAYDVDNFPILFYAYTSEVGLTLHLPADCTEDQQTAWTSKDWGTSTTGTITYVFDQ